MMRECHVRICERLGVKLPGPTRHGLPNNSSRVSVRCTLGLLSDLCAAVLSGRIWLLCDPNLQSVDQPPPFRALRCNVGGKFYSRGAYRFSDHGRKAITNSLL